MRSAAYSAAVSLALLAGCGAFDRSSGGSKSSPPPAATGTATGTTTGTGTGTGTSTGTGTATTGAVPTPPPGPVTPVLVYLGGFTSCGGGNSPDPTTSAIAPLFDEARNQIQGSAWLLACYALDPTNVVFTRSIDQGAVKTDTVDHMLQALDQLTASVHSPVLFVVGHSYGGWTAMDVVLHTKTYVANLVTLDPISKVDCTPSGFFSDSPGCTRAPTDFGPNGLAQIAAKVPGKWQNFYQTDLAALHSGPIAQTPSNTKRSYPGAQGFDAHNDLLTDQAVAAAIQTALQGLTP